MIISCRALNNIEKNNKRLASVGKVKYVSAISSHADCVYTFPLSKERKVTNAENEKKKSKIQNLLVHWSSTLKITNRFKIGFVDENLPIV